MAGVFGQKTVLRRWNIDISALLLIAFVYQIVWPVTVLAAPDLSKEFGNDFRASICYALADTGNDQNQPESNRDTFFCDWCVLSKQISHGYVLPAGFDFPIHHLLVQKVSHLLFDDVRVTSYVHQAFNPRAPPFFFI